MVDLESNKSIFKIKKKHIGALRVELVDWKMQVHSGRGRTADSSQAGEQANAGSRVVRQAEVGNDQAAEVQNQIQRGVRAGQGRHQVSREGTGTVGRRQSRVTSWVSNQLSGTRKKQSQTGWVYTGTSTGSDGRS